MKSLALAVTTAVLLGVSQSPAVAALVSFGTAEFVSARDCSPGETACDTLLPASIGLYGGTPGAASSTASFSDPTFGSAFGSVSLSGVVGAPVLKALAASEEGKRVSTNSVALQRYTYTGTKPVKRTFGGDLTYSQSLTGDYPPEGGLSGVNAILWIFKTTTDVVDVGNTPDSNFSSLFRFPFLASYEAGFEELGFDQFEDRNAIVTDGAHTLNVTVDLNPGDAIWVWASLQTPAANGSVVDASQTLVTSWDNPESFVPAAQVPEPTTIALMACGFLGLGLTAAANRRRVISG